ncbi:unnamed protein product [Schistocephalus solidus]|uniref:Restriction endonuclease n=1 Tax=Schistocephalus solidus TaxID=70667 RepID=A0A183SU07_SCHSO|nr:unnamed protein product [Schistocephalus solidus]
MYLTFENQRVKFFPSYEDLEELIVFVAQQIMDSLQKVPTIQSWLHQQANNRYIDGKVPDHIASLALTKLRNAAKSNFQRPLEFFQKTIVQPYSYLFDGTESKSVDAFLKEDGDFKDYRNYLQRKEDPFTWHFLYLLIPFNGPFYLQYITKLHNLAQEVMLLPDAEYFDLIRLDCEDVKVGLSKECQRLANTLLERVATKLRQTNKEYVSCVS